MAITLKANVRWGGVDYAPGATIPGLTPSDEAGLVSSNRAEWVGTPSTTSNAAVPVMTTTGPGGGVASQWKRSDVNGSIDVPALSNIALPAELIRAASGKAVWLWRHSAGSQPLQNSLWAYVPVGGGYYSGFAYGTWALAGAVVNHLGRQFLGVIGTWRNHLAPGVVKTGAGWATSALNYAPDGTITRSADAGNTYTDTVTGHTIIMRGLQMSGAGFGVVSIDGDWTAANRLPTFTQADYDAGLCRLSDIGKRYLAQGASVVVSDYHIPIAEGLTDEPHTVVIEVCGTKRAAQTSTRIYVGGLVGCSSADIENPLGATRVIGKLRDVQDLRTSSASALLYTPEVEKSLAAGTFEFLGEVHAGETLVAEQMLMDGVAVTLAAGEYKSGTTLVIDRVSTIASTDATATPVCEKRARMIFSALGVCPLVVHQSQKWLVDKNVRNEFPLMLAAGQRALPSGSEQPNFNSCNLGGNWQSSPSDFMGDAAAQRGNVPAQYAILSSDQHDVVAYATMLDGGQAVNYWADSVPDLVYLHDRSEDKLDKVYFASATASTRPTRYAGEVFRGVVGLGTIKRGTKF